MIEPVTDTQKRRPIILICSPLAGRMRHNMSKARKYCRFAIECGYMPIAPHLIYPQFMNDRDKADRALAMSFGMSLLERCDGLWAFGGVASPGMRAEIDAARRLGMAIKYFNKEYREVVPFA